MQGNHEFGISRIVKSLEPYSSKLGTDTWFYAKRCLLSLAEGLAKHMIQFKESAWAELMAFLDEAENHGKAIPAAFAGAGGNDSKAGRGAASAEGQTVAAEARMLKCLFMKLQES